MMESKKIIIYISTDELYSFFFIFISELIIILIIHIHSYITMKLADIAAPIIALIKLTALLLIIDIPFS